MQVTELSVLKVCCSIEEAVIGGLLDQADDDAHVSARPLQRIESRVPGRQGHGGDQVLEEVAGEGEFRKEEEVYALSLCFAQDLVVEGEVSVQVAKDRAKLGNSQGELLHRRLPFLDSPQRI